VDSHAVVGGVVVVVVVVVIVACTCMCSEVRVPGELRSTTERVSFELSSNVLLRPEVTFLYHF
jgi:hypothetical protein